MTWPDRFEWPLLLLAAAVAFVPIFIDPAGLGSRLGVTSKIAAYLLLLTRFSLLTGLSALWLRRRGMSLDIWSPAARPARRMVGLLTGVYLLAFGVFTVQRHVFFNSSAYDLGIYHQVVWNTSRGNWFASSFEVTNRLADHFQPLVALLAPAYWIAPSPLVLIIFQTVVLASGSVPVFLLARKILHNNALAIGVAYAYLFYPALGYLNRFDFHWEATVVPLFLWAILAVEQHKKGLASLLLLLCLFGKEDVGLTVAAFGVWIALTHGRGWRVYGLAWATGGVLFSLTAVLVVIPYFNVDGVDTLNRYAWMGDSPAEIIRFAVSQPLAVIRYLFGLDGIRYLFSLLGPLLFLPLLGSISLVAAPAFAYNGLSDFIAQKTVYFHYTAPMIPFMIAGAIYGLRRLTGWADRFKMPWLPPAALVGLLLFTSFHFWLVNSPLLDDGTVRAAWTRQPNHAAVRKGLALIPDDARLFTTNHYAVHKAARPAVQMPFTSSDLAYLEEADLFFINLRDRRSPAEEDFTCDDMAIMLYRAYELGFTPVYRENGVLLLEKSAVQSSTLREISDSLCP